MGARAGNRNNSKIKLARGGTRKGSPQNGDGPKCDRKKTGGGKCLLPAGWGTDHVGIGHCKWHGGASLTHRKKAWNVELNRMLGEEFEIDPINALMWLIRLAAGDVQYWRQEVARLQLEAQDLGYTPSEALLTKAVELEHQYIPESIKVAVQRYDMAQERLAKHAKMALDVGIADRAVRLAEAYGETIALLIAGILGDLWEQPAEVLPTWSKERLKKIAEQSVSRRLLELESQSAFGDVIATDGEGNAVHAELVA